MRFRWSLIWKVAVLAAAGSFASYVTVRRSRSGLGIGLDGSHAARAQARDSSSPRPPYDLPAMAALRFVLLDISDRYVDPARVHPREMLLKGLEAIQRSVAQVLVSHEENSPTVTVRVDTHEHVFGVSDVQGPWDLQSRWREIMVFLQEHLRDVPDVNLQDVEYAACNGMLRTLDPHSVLLSPEAFHEMQIQTGGHFGGLGIVISIRDGQLTIMNPMPGTPAAHAGLRRFDRIVQIGNESTLNMTLQEAVNRLRGEEGSPVEAYITREGADGWAAPRRFRLVRAVIHVDSVESRMLAGGVGYARIKSFSEDTAEELTRALQTLRSQNMRALVLDMRGNPGGLLEQAVEVADLFLRDGVIVVTAGNRAEGREERRAEARGTEPNYPMAVLIDGGSASASEIVAGALKNNNRAIVLGQTSFGKGSVQTLRNLRDGGALKITIAQYLTPGDVSIQGVGITPDIQLDPMTVDPLDMDLDADRAFLREADLHAHLTSNRARDGGRATESMGYFFPLEEREALRERGPDDPGEAGWHEDVPTRIAREALSVATRAGRTELLQDLRPTLERLRNAEIEQVTRALAALPSRVDWTVGADAGASALEVRTQLSGTEAVPGRPFDLTVTVTNRGSHPVYRLRATTKSDNPLFMNRELLFGRVAPGETRTWTAPLGLCQIEGYRPGSTTQPPPGARRVCTVPRASLSRVDGIRLEFSEQYGHLPEAVPPVRAEVRGLERPVYAYGWQLADNITGNGDGRLQRGEQVTLYFTLHNNGRGAGFTAQANLKNTSGQGVLLHAGRFHVDGLEPDGERRVAFTFEVQSSFRAEEVRLEVQVVDEDLREFVTQKIRIPIAPATTVANASGSWTARADGVAIEAPAVDARAVARIAAGTTLPVTAQAGEWSRVDLGERRPGWVRRSDGNGAARAQHGPVAFMLHNSPPAIEISSGAALAVRNGTLHVAGNATDESRVLDMYVFVGSRKVYYQSNRNGADPRRVHFETDLPLRAGSNIVTIVVREDNDTLARRVLVVRRDGANGELLATPQQSGADEEDDDE